jgi:hypothetical protein
MDSSSTLSFEAASLSNSFLAGQHGQHLALDGLAADDHVQSGLHAQHARQALCATGAGQQAKLDFGQGHAGARCRHAVVATQASSRPPPMTTVWMAATTGLGEFSSTEMTLSRLGSCMALAVPNSLMSAPPEKAFSCTGDDNGLDRGVGIGLGHAVSNALAGGQPQTVHRRVVQRDDGDVAMDLVLGSHACIPRKWKKIERSFVFNCIGDPGRFCPTFVTVGTRLYTSL